MQSGSLLIFICLVLDSNIFIIFIKPASETPIESNSFIISAA